MTTVRINPSWPEFGHDGLDTALVDALVARVVARQRDADHALLLLLRCLLADDLPGRQRRLATEAVLGFRYGLVDPRRDPMDAWMEHRQLSFATAELLAGQLFGDQTFAVDGRVGVRHMRTARVQLSTWLSDRFYFGFSEWLSPSCYASNAAALGLLVDHASDKDIRARAGIVLDLLLADIALHGFNHRLGATMGVGFTEELICPSASPLHQVWERAFGEDNPQVDPSSVLSLFITSHHQAPPALCQIANQPVRRVISSHGLDPHEVPSALNTHPWFPRTAIRDRIRFWWGQHALSKADSMRNSVRGFQEFGDDGWLSAIRDALSPRRLTDWVVRCLNPVPAGATLGRANVQTVSTANYLLSSVQRYAPGAFGSQQHLWHASLPGDVEVFGTHPGSVKRFPMSSIAPGEWVGNGINPDIAQHHNVLLASYDLTNRQARRARWVHFHFPFVDLDRAGLGRDWVAGRRSDGYVGILSTHRFEQISESELVVRAARGAYLVICGDDEEFGSLREFIRVLREHSITRHGDTVTAEGPHGRFALRSGGPFRVNGRLVGTEYPRCEAPGVLIPRNPISITFQGDTHKLVLDWATGSRHTTRIS